MMSSNNERTFLFQMLISQSFISDVGPTQVEISLTIMRHTTCARGAIVSAKLTCHVAIFSCRSLAQSFKGTLINLSVVETTMFCVEFSTLSFVVPEMWAFPVRLTIVPFCLVKVIVHTPLYSNYKDPPPKTYCISTIIKLGFRSARLPCTSVTNLRQTVMTPSNNELIFLY